MAIAAAPQWLDSSQPKSNSKLNSIKTQTVLDRHQHPRAELINHRRLANSYPLVGGALLWACLLLALASIAPPHALALRLHSKDHSQPALSSRSIKMAHSRHSGSVQAKAVDEEDSGQLDFDSAHINGAVSATYFVNWAIYGRSHYPWQIPLDSVTHVLYAFANVKPESGEVYLTDSWADEQIHWADRGDSWNDQGNNLYGCFNQFRQLKQQHRHLKLLISIGGWTYSSNFAPATDSPAKRQKFADSAVGILENYGLDGIDVDWEYPTNDQEAANFVDILRRMRESLDSLKQKKKDRTPYLLTIAAPCGPTHYKQLHLKEMNKYLSFINLMAYDYAGSWDTISGHQANLKWPTSTTVNQGNFSTSAAVRYYLSQSVPSSKLVIGMPLYGRSFMNTKGIGQPYDGIGQGTWEAGVYDYKAIPTENVKLVHDDKVVGAYTYNPSTQELITFDNPETVHHKARYVRQHSLGGVMWWESSGDKTTAGEALIPLAAGLLGKLDTLSNHLNYPDSKWDNLKNGHASSSIVDNPVTGHHHTAYHPGNHQNKKRGSTPHTTSDSKTVQGSY